MSQTTYKGPRLPITQHAYTSGEAIISYETEIFPESKSLYETIYSSITNLLRTRIGERVMSSYGCNTESLTFEKSDNDTAALGTNMITEAISQFEGRVSIENVYHKFINSDTIEWTIVLRAIGDADNLVTMNLRNK